MDIATVLTDILIVLVGAKVAAELAERIGVPAVVGEIVAGVLIGPSALNLVGHHDQVLRTLGEIGVILLLLEVGMEMDMGELAKVGRASMLVATVGVVTPLALPRSRPPAWGSPPGCSATSGRWRRPKRASCSVRRSPTTSWAWSC